MITFQIDNIIKDPESSKLEDNWELMINVEGDLKIYLNGSLFFSEPMMTIVELAVELNKWLSKPVGSSFKYETIDDDEENILNITAVSDNQFIFDSAWQEVEFIDSFNREEVVVFVRNYINHVISAVKKNLGVNLSERIGL